MPPKGSSFRPARGRGGRGRGRGASSASTADPGPLVSKDPESQSTLDESSTQPARTITPQNPQLDPQDEYSPNSSPATVPTETPAPTPARKPILKKTSSMGVLSSRGEKNVAGPPEGMVETPILPPSRTSASSRPEPIKALQADEQDTSAGRDAEPTSVPARGRGRPSLARGTAKPATESRFKPKNVRRDAGELEQLAKKEQMRLAGIAANNAREQARWLRGRGRPARGRGDVMGRGAGSRSASGVFGVMPEGISKGPGFYPGRSAGGSGGGASGGGPGGGSGGASGSGTSRTKQESGGVRHVHIESGGGGHDHPQYPDLEVGDFVNIEQINTLPDSSDDDVVFTGSRPVRKNRSAGGGLKPVRLQREEHKERATIVNTETTIKISDSDDEDIPTIDEAKSGQRAAKDRAFKGVYSDPAEITIKSEPRDDGPPSSPETKLKVKGKERALSSTVDVDLPDLPPQEDKKDHKSRKTYKKINKKPVIQTEEDREEYERHLEDVAVLAYELGGLQGNLSSTSAPGPSTAVNRPADSEETATDADGDTPMEKTDDVDKDKADERSGRLYLFQFPPVLPELYNVANGKPKSHVEIKKEEEDAATAAREAEVTANSLTAKGKGKAKDRVDLTASISGLGTAATSSTAIKLEDNDGVAPKHPIQFPGKHTIQEEGWIGKLVVRKSGRVELSWGGTSLLVGRGVDAGFLTAGVLVDSPATGPGGGGEGLGGSGISNASEGSAVGMGQIMGKFVVTPDWENMA